MSQTPINPEPVPPLVEDWQMILWREWRSCDDELYAQQLAQLVADLPMGWTGEWQDRPLALEIEAALAQACQLLPEAQAVWAKPLGLLAEQRNTPGLPDKLAADLANPAWHKRFIARHTLATLGGEAVPHLLVLAQQENSPLQLLAIWLLRNIEAETTPRLFPYLARLLCPRCLVRCHAHWVEVSWLQRFVYYGCRACGQSREFLDYTGQIVTVLDTAMTVPHIQEADTLRGNWFQHQSLFDADRVEIIQASDEAVERFAVQVGNDTDEIRQPRYRDTPCLISPECGLSENTLRILRRTFGRVDYLIESKKAITNSTN